MSVNALIESALSQICTEVVADVYKGPAKEYITFSYQIVPSNYADNSAEALVYLIMVHYCCPSRTNSLAKRKLIRQTLADFCTYPTESNLTDENGQEYVYTCEYTDGDV